MKDFGNGRISIGLNHGTVHTEEKDVIYIQTEYHSYYGYDSPDDGIIAITVEDAEILSKELLKFVALFKNKEE